MFTPCTPPRLVSTSCGSQASLRAPAFIAVGNVFSYDLLGAVLPTVIGRSKARLWFSYKVTRGSGSP
ncbi:hypothetical protein AAFF_G00428030 [Aldrovandia affinis]|uniref:Uncharacterized protein n=1 Tax=Aldrovandia affinis TaxID=143900 RepID=A0AAD7WIN1_9TELE|nr:hypothetical protein AAFF_G00428030 [Aldrovandia affinis]